MAFTIGFLSGTSVIRVAAVGTGLVAIKRPSFAIGVRIAGLLTAALGMGLLARG